MSALLLIVSVVLHTLWSASSPPWYQAARLPVTGEVTFYAASVMENVYHIRLERAQVPYCDRPACVGYIATLRPGDLGRKVWLQLPGGQVEGPFLVVDYAAAEDFTRLAQRGLIAEVDNVTARRWAMRGPLYGVTMLARPPERRTLLPLILRASR